MKRLIKFLSQPLVTFALQLLSGDPVLSAAALLNEYFDNRFLKELEESGFV